MNRPRTEPQGDRRAFVEDEFRALADLAERTSKELGDRLPGIADLLAACLRRGGQVLFCGNGGSAADAQHMAAELVVRLDQDRPGLRARALTTDASVLTAVSNDLGYENAFARQVEALAAPGDVLVLISTSGNSANLTRAAEAARRTAVATVALLGKGGGELLSCVDHALVVPSDRTAHVQEIHGAIGHVLCALVERAMFGIRPGPGPRACG
jgi:D-sedoheptulose 7-phosphate isomerase